MTHSRTSSTLSTRSECSQGELSVWRMALDQFDFGEYRDAYQSFAGIEPRAKVLYNMAMCAFLFNDRQEALECLKRCVGCDPYLAIASYQLACLHLDLDDTEKAITAFELAVKGMRDSVDIDYGILGPDVILHTANMHCQLGLGYFKFGDNQRAFDALLCAWDGRRKHDEEHGSGDVERLSMTEIFRPSALRMQGLDPQDYLGSALVVAVTKPTDHIGRIHVKCCLQEDVRMFAIDVADVRILRQAIINKFGLATKNFKVKYKDEVGEMVILCDDDDLVRAVKGRFLRIVIQPLTDPLSQ